MAARLALNLVVAASVAGLGCAGKGGSPPFDASDASDDAAGGTMGAGGTSGAGGAVYGAGGASGGAGRGAGGGVGGAPAAAGGQTGSGGAGPNLANCPIRTCVQRLNALQTDCAAFGAACIKEVHGSQTNYCFANGVRTYLDANGVTGLATIIRPDGHTCYTIYFTYSAGGPTTGAIKDPDGNTVMLETDSADNKTITFSCNSVQWVEDGTSCGVGGINAFPFYFVDCSQTSGQMCLRP